MYDFEDEVDQLLVESTVTSSRSRVVLIIIHLWNILDGIHTISALYKVRCVGQYWLVSETCDRDEVNSLRKRRKDRQEMTATMDQSVRDS